jgi:hypothetical protein
VSGGLIEFGLKRVGSWLPIIWSWKEQPSFLYYTTSRNQEKLLISFGNDHLYRASNYSWDAHIQS